MRRRSGVLGVGVVACVLAGCTAPAGDPAPPPASAAPAATEQVPPEPTTSSSTETPAPTPTPSPPELPEAATRDDQEGASAFVRHYFEVGSFSYVTGDTRPLEDLSADDCVACANIAETIDDLWSGGSVEGGVLVVKDVQSAPGDPERGIVSSVLWDQDAYDVLDSEGEVVEAFPGYQNFAATSVVEWVGDSWAMSEWGAVDATDR